MAAEIPVLITNVRVPPVPGDDFCPELPLPLVTAPEDRAIALAVQEALANDHRLRETDLGLIVADGVLLLRGRTSSAYEKRIAGQRARAIPGVRDVCLDVFVGRVPP